MVARRILIGELLCRIIIVERGNEANSYEELLLRIIIIFIVLIVLLLFSLYTSVWLRFHPGCGKSFHL